MRSKERALERTQKVLGEISDDAGRTYRQIFVQDYTFNPRGATYQREEQRFDRVQVDHLRLTIVPNKNGSGRAMLTTLRLFPRPQSRWVKCEKTSFGLAPLVKFKSAQLL